MADFGKLLHRNFKRLAEAGCKHIQIDEPYFTPSSDDEVKAAVDVINLAVEGLPDDVSCAGPYLPGQLRGGTRITTARSDTAISTRAATRRISSARSIATPFSSSTT